MGANLSMWRTVLGIDGRRLLSILFQSALTFPFSYLVGCRYCVTPGLKALGFGQRLTL